MAPSTDGSSRDWFRLTSAEYVALGDEGKREYSAWMEEWKRAELPRLRTQVRREESTHRSTLPRTPNAGIKLTKTQFTIWLWVVVLVATAVSITLIATGQIGRTDATFAANEDASATSSAVTDLADQSGEDPLDVQDALDGLSTSCYDSQQNLAAEVSKSLADLESYGITESATNFINEVSTSIPASIAPTDCAQQMGALLVLKEQ